ATTGAVINADFIPVFAYGMALDDSNHLFVGNGDDKVGEYDATTGAAINADFITGLSNEWSIAFVPAVPLGLPGDFNHDGTVSDADYVAWRKGPGTTFTPSDYGVWRSHFGQTAGSGAGVSVNSAVPEPGTLALVVFAAAGWFLQRRGAA